MGNRRLNSSFGIMGLLAKGYKATCIPRYIINSFPNSETSQSPTTTRSTIHRTQSVNPINSHPKTCILRIILFSKTLILAILSLAASTTAQDRRHRLQTRQPPRARRLRRRLPRGRGRHSKSYCQKSAGPFALSLGVPLSPFLLLKRLTTY